MPSKGLDLFISHASEDKSEIARPLFEALRDLGVSVWYDEATLELGDSLRRKIDDGLARCRYGVVILSPAFLAKEWPQRELDGLVAKETASGEKAILPVWHNINREALVRHSPPLADKLAVSSAEGVASIVEKILRVLRSREEPDAEENGDPSIVGLRFSAQIRDGTLPSAPDVAGVTNRKRSTVTADGRLPGRNRLLGGAFVATLAVAAAVAAERRFGGAPAPGVVSIPSLSTTVTAGNAVLYDGMIDPDRSGIRFSAAKIESWFSGHSDLGVSTQSQSGRPGEGVLSFFLPYDAPPYSGSPQDKDGQAGIQDMGALSLSEISECPPAGYTSQWFVPQEDHSYCLRTRDGHHYAKIRILREFSDRIAFDWQYQTTGAVRF